jgi:hypothetical protein
MYFWSSIHDITSICVSVHKTVIRNYLEVHYSIEYENVGKNIIFCGAKEYNYVYS